MENGDIPASYVSLPEGNPSETHLFWVIYIKGQLGVPLAVYPWYLLCSLLILGDSNPIYTHYIGLI